MSLSTSSRRQSIASSAGYSIVELMVAVGIMLVVSTGVFHGLMKISQVQGTVTNRSELHSGVRNATELLQQEVGQAGRIAVPVALTLNGTVNAGGTTAVLNSVAGVFPASGGVGGEKLVFGAGDSEETLTVSAVNITTKQVTLTSAFASQHLNGTAVRVQGGFYHGVIPTNVTNGSTATKLKIFGDINGDGNMVYVEYFCDTTSGNLYRNSMAFDTAPANKPPLTTSLALLNNIKPNPDGTACFVYQEEDVPDALTANPPKRFVTDVAITLTVETADVDPVTKQKQTETKALLNVSPRNVFNLWQQAGQPGSGATNRLQDTPATVTALLAN